jgi:hypothetical protein
MTRVHACELRVTYKTMARKLKDESIIMEVYEIQSKTGIYLDKVKMITLLQKQYMPMNPSV